MESGYNCRRETVTLDGQWLWDFAVKFARWQHPAVGRCEICCDWHRLFKCWR